MLTSFAQRLCVLREVAILAVLSHPNIVRLLDVVWTEHAVHVFQEHVDGIELFEFLRTGDRPGRLGEDEARSIALQCLNALQHMHDRRVLHRDIKLDNIMVLQPGSPSNPHPFPVVKIIDFNLSTFYHPAHFLHETVGCIHYSSAFVCAQAAASAAFASDPNLRRPMGLAPAVYGIASDIWALVVSLFGALQAYFPFRQTTVETLAAEIANVCHGPLGARLIYPTRITSAARHFLESGMDPAAPSTAHALLWHPWLAPLNDLGAVYPILRREGLFVAGQHSAPSPWDLLIPPEGVDDSWYLMTLFSASPRDRRGESNEDGSMQEEKKAMDRSIHALASIAARARGGYATSYPSPVPKAIALPDCVYGDDALNARSMQPVNNAYCSVGEMPKPASVDSGYASSDFNVTLSSADSVFGRHC